MEEYGQTINQRKDVIINESYRVNDILWGDSFREK